jgi:hypothetical protein
MFSTVILGAGLKTALFTTFSLGNILGFYHVSVSTECVEFQLNQMLRHGRTGGFDVSCQSEESFRLAAAHRSDDLFSPISSARDMPIMLNELCVNRRVQDLVPMIRNERNSGALSLEPLAMSDLNFRDLKLVSVEMGSTGNRMRQ